MSMYQQVFVSMIVLGVLYFLSMQFNRYIDNRRDLYDGETAQWVVLGTTYTIIGYGIIIAIWWAKIHVIASPWQAAFVLGGALFLCFVASGIPMYVGDAVRAHKRRQEQGR